MDQDTGGGLYAQFQTNPDVERTGIELEYRTGPKTAAVIRIARAGGGNTKYNRALDAKTKPYRRQIQTDTIEPAQLDAIMREVYADSVVLGWTGVTGPDGKELPFTRDNCVKLFTDLPDLFADVQTQAQKVSLFRKQQLEAAAGN